MQMSIEYHYSYHTFQSYIFMHYIYESNKHNHKFLRTFRTCDKIYCIYICIIIMSYAFCML